MTREEAKNKIAELVAKFGSLTPAKVKEYNEEATKNGFIEPLFRALGWDTENTDEVSPEENASKGRVDYAFKLHGISQYYVEAKPLKADINSPDYIKQAVTYAYNKGVTWAVLTNFESLRIFNAQKQSQSIPIDYKHYIDDFERLWLLSKESLETGLLTKEAQKWGILPPPLPVEKRLFTQLRQWREELFNQLYGHNKEILNFTQIDEVIQRFFNRLIFIRNAEDRGIEDKKLLSAVHQWKSNNYKKDSLRKALAQIFQYYDGYYDSDLFAIHLLDNEKLFIEETTIEGILSGLYEIPGSMASYDFSIIDADVLGAVYEQYLGYVAVKAKEKAEAQLKLGISDDEVFTVTSKKSHRKEQGIYYTPKFITDYIVKETVGRFIEERHDRPNEILDMKILDPACGSGSFLIRAYDELLNYHAYQRGKHSSQLEQPERLTVLLKNIFGVDLDKQAVEIARLNLLLRSLAKRELLPSLADNIKQGNSLISGAEDELKEYFGDGWQEKDAFNWEEEFKSIVDKGGFDVVIGNPPYGAEFDENDRSYIGGHYPHSKDNKNSAMVFIEKGLSLTKEGGYFCFIIPKSLAYSQKWASGRKLIMEKLGCASDASKAFKEVLLEQMVIVVSQKFVSRPYYESVLLTEGIHKEKVKITKAIATSVDTVPLGINIEELTVFTRMTSSNLFMRDISKTSRGLPFQKYLSKNPNNIPVYRGDSISRYSLHETKDFLSDDVLSKAGTKATFLKQPKILSQRIVAHVLKPSDHIIIMSAFDKDGVLTVDTVENTVLTDKGFNYNFILAMMNSKLWSWYGYRFVFSKAVRTMDLDEYYLGKFPLPSVNMNNPVEKKLNDELAALADKMLELKKKLHQLSEYETDRRQQIEKLIKSTDEKIDNLVYKLYGLTPEEIKAVEGRS